LPMPIMAVADDDAVAGATDGEDSGLGIVDESASRIDLRAIRRC